MVSGLRPVRKLVLLGEQMACCTKAFSRRRAEEASSSRAGVDMVGEEKWRELVEA